LNLGLQQSWALPRSLDLIGRIDWEHRGKTYWTLDNVDTQEAYDLVNLSLGLDKEHWEVRLFVNNLLDEQYIEWFFAARFIGLPADIAWPSRPRQVGMELSLRF
jgi:outer membrane receptor protein involved in Fe transport